MSRKSLVIRKAFQLGESIVVCLPQNFAQKGDFITIERKDDSLILKKLEVQ